MGMKYVIEIVFICSNEMGNKENLEKIRFALLHFSLFIHFFLLQLC